MYSITSVASHFEAPFYDLASMKSSGNRIAYSSTIDNEIITKLLQTEFPDRELLGELTRHGPEGIISFYDRLKQPEILQNDPPSLYLEATEWSPHKTCHYFPTHVNIQITPTTTRTFPDEFFFPYGSFVITKTLPLHRKLLESALLQLSETGNIVAMKRKFFPQRQQNDLIREQCKRLNSDRIIPLPYDKQSTTIAESASVFILWFIGLNVAGVEFVLEFLFRRRKVELQAEIAEDDFDRIEVIQAFAELMHQDRNGEAIKRIQRVIKEEQDVLDKS